MHPQSITVQFTPELTERIWSRIDTTGGDDACWEWTAGRWTRFGYGRLKYHGVDYRAHRLVWAQLRGPIPHGLCVLHQCDNPPCCNPAHLFLGTKADNTADMMAKGRGRWVAPHLCGEMSSSRRHPERLPRGDAHWTRRMPERLVVRRGEQHYAAQFTWEQVREIRSRYAAGGVQQKQLAAEYGVNFRTIWNIVRHRYWRDDGGEQVSR